MLETLQVPGNSKKSLVWTDDEVELLLNVTLDYKKSMAAHDVEWESVQRRYEDITDLFLKKYPSPEDASASRKDFPHAMDEITKGIPFVNELHLYLTDVTVAVTQRSTVVTLWLSPACLTSSYLALCVHLICVLWKMDTERESWRASEESKWTLGWREPLLCSVNIDLTYWVFLLEAYIYKKISLLKHVGPSAVPCRLQVDRQIGVHAHQCSCTVLLPSSKMHNVDLL